MDINEFHDFGYEALDFVAEYLTSVHKRYLRR